MKLFMKCKTVIDTVYESDKDDTLPVLTRVCAELHLLFCPGCAAQFKNLRRVEEIMKNDFFPDSPDFAESLMEQLFEEKESVETIEVQAGFSFKSWVFIGFFVLLSLTSAYFGMNYTQIASSEVLSFILPLGITVGLVLSCYGALFIGSHLKELSNRFRIH
jgi:hypothetical protein